MYTFENLYKKHKKIWYCKQNLTFCLSYDGSPTKNILYKIYTICIFSTRKKVRQLYIYILLHFHWVEIQHYTIHLYNHYISSHLHIHVLKLFFQHITCKAFLA